MYVDFTPLIFLMLFFVSLALMCRNCKSIDVEFWCENCNENYCSECCEILHKKHNFSGHQPVKTRTKPLEIVRCDSHIDVEVKHWCYTCDILVCDNCVKKEHKDHKYVLTNKAANEVSTQVDIEYYFHSYHLLIYLL